MRGGFESGEGGEREGGNLYYARACKFVWMGSKGRGGGSTRCCLLKLARLMVCRERGYLMHALRNGSLYAADEWA